MNDAHDVALAEWGTGSPLPSASGTYVKLHYGQLIKEGKV
jgi:hypothetical protein